MWGREQERQFQRNVVRGTPLLALKMEGDHKASTKVASRSWFRKEEELPLEPPEVNAAC